MKNRRIVISVDDKLTAHNLNRHLQELGYLVIGSAADSGAAIELCKTLAPDLLIMDIDIPERNDFQAAKTLKECTRIPVVMISGCFDENIGAAAANSGITGFLVKPVEKKHLAPAVEIALQTHRNYCKSLEELSQLRQTYYLDKC